MAKMLSKTNKARQGTCPYGWKCCTNNEHALGHKKMRRYVKRAERNTWKRNIFAD